MNITKMNVIDIISEAVKGQPNLDEELIGDIANETAEIISEFEEMETSFSYTPEMVPVIFDESTGNYYVEYDMLRKLIESADPETIEVITKYGTIGFTPKVDSEMPINEEEPEESDDDDDKEEKEEYEESYRYFREGDCGKKDCDDDDDDYDDDDYDDDDYDDDDDRDCDEGCQTEGCKSGKGTCKGEACNSGKGTCKGEACNSGKGTCQKEGCKNEGCNSGKGTCKGEACNSGKGTCQKEGCNSGKGTCSSKGEACKESCLYGGCSERDALAAVILANMPQDPNRGEMQDDCYDMNDECMPAMTFENTFIVIESDDELMDYIDDICESAKKGGVPLKNGKAKLKKANAIFKNLSNQGLKVVKKKSKNKKKNKGITVRGKVNVGLYTSRNKNSKRKVVRIP